MPQIHHSLGQIKPKHIFQFTDGPQLRIEFLCVRLHLARFDEYWYFDILVLVRLLDVFDQTLLVLHEVCFVVTLGYPELATLLDILIFEYVHDAIPLHGCILVFGAANVRLVRHWRYLFRFNLFHLGYQLELFKWDILTIGYELIFVILEVQVTDFVTLDLLPVVELLKGTLLVLGQNCVNFTSTGVRLRQYVCFDDGCCG